MQKVLPPLLGMLCLTPIWVYPTQAQAATSQCDRTLKSVQASLPSTMPFKLKKISGAGKPPQGRSKYLGIIFNGGTNNNYTAGETLMKDGNRQLLIAKKVISGCSQVGSVSFAMKETDWIVTYGMINGKVKHFTCVEAGPRAPALRWGETYCI
jgi:hypothetical protein